VLEKVKLALRITTSFLDDEILDSIAEARQELVRAGVNETLANSNNELIVKAVKTYCQAQLTGDLNARDKFNESFIFQLDNIRKSTITVTEANDV